MASAGGGGGGAEREPFACVATCECENNEEKWNHCRDCDAKNCDFGPRKEDGWGYDADEKWLCPPCYKKAATNKIFVFEDGETWSSGKPTVCFVTDAQLENLDEPRKEDWFDTNNHEMAGITQEQLEAILALVPAEHADKVTAMLGDGQ